MALVHICNEATKGDAWVPAKSVGTWALHGWQVVNPEPVETEDSAAEAETTSRGKSSAKTQKDK